MLKKTELDLDKSNGHVHQAAKNADEIKQLNRSIFLPVTKRNRKNESGKREDESWKRQDESGKHRYVSSYEGKYPGDNDLLGGSSTPLKKQPGRHGRYQFEPTTSDDELEDEIDDNLGRIGDAVRRLNDLGVAMGEELGRQNEHIEKITGKTDRLAGKLEGTTEKVRCYLKLISDLI